ncbi:hypothetical protein GZ212_10905 [Mangrovimonas sp. CR14]|uniref:hypothetical protein n=1 Tax=Mangrovimonas sp. CR14 TaxID=2706120 RepID=UPI001420EC74|nr:hypothetical protein [Mangrovimonas sp. CR14]NIK92660.1 hypothetical protein [Mangrovimonas sp. CR14]
MSNKKQEKIVFALFLLLLILLAVYRNIKRNNELEKYGEETTCKVVEFRFVNKTSYRIVYEYYINNVSYKGEEDTVYFKCEDGTEGCIGETFKLLYSTRNPKLSKIQLGKYSKYSKNKVQLGMAP